MITEQELFDIGFYKTGYEWQSPDDLFYRITFKNEVFNQRYLAGNFLNIDTRLHCEYDENKKLVFDIYGLPNKLFLTAYHIKLLIHSLGADVDFEYQKNQITIINDFIKSRENK
jgi:hypothetical protein